MDRITLIAKAGDGYALTDSGGEEKLERFGDQVVVRPDPQALWPKANEAAWSSANGRYVREGEAGKWTGNIPKEWRVELGGLTMLVKPTSFKHVGVFPEHVPGWEWIKQQLLAVLSGSGSAESTDAALAAGARWTGGQKEDKPKILNLFGYTGGYTLAAAKAGAEVTHVDASKTAVAWARENAELNGLGEAPIRWVVEDALAYVRREIKRGSKYDAIIMDPPAFGHGPDGELWKFEEHFVELMQLCEQLLSDQPLFVLINGYAASYSPLAFAYNLESINKKFGGRIEYGDLAIAEEQGERLLPAGIFARWIKG